MLKTFKLFKLERWPNPPPRIAGSVRHLELVACPGLTSTACFEHLAELEVLHLGLCPDLVHVSLGCFAKLVELSLVDISLAALDELQLAPNLRTVYLSGLNRLARISGPSVEQQSLQALNICRCIGLHDIAGIANLTGLRQLVFDRLPELEDLSALEGLRRLSELVLDDCPKVTRIASLVRLPALRSVTISRCPAIADLDLWAARSDVALHVS